jgi:hypothetical protein
MTTFFTLNDGRSWLHQNWAYDAVLESIADVLDEDAGGRELAAWLRDQRCLVQGPGVGSVDLRELTVENQRRIVGAVPRALEMARAKGPKGWHDPSYFPAWLSSFELLARMVEAVERGEPPGEPMHGVRGLLPPTGLRSGPGW